MATELDREKLARNEKNTPNTTQIQFKSSMLPYDYELPGVTLASYLNAHKILSCEYKHVAGLFFDKRKHVTNRFFLANRSVQTGEGVPSSVRVNLVSSLNLEVDAQLIRT